MQDMQTKMNNSSVTWKQLYKKPQTVLFPFELQVSTELPSVRCEQLLRLLPKKRMVFAGNWQGVPVIVKIFLQPGRAGQHWAHEVKHLKKLAETGIAMPKLLYCGKSMHDKMPVLITSKIEQAIGLDSLWQRHAFTTYGTRLMEAMTLELATQHVMGVVQNDLHLGNFLLKQQDIYTIDCAAIQFFNEPLSPDKSIDHLALFFAQLGAGTEKLCDALYTLYAKARGWQIKESDFVYLRKKTHLYLRRRLNLFKEKAMRNSTQFSRKSFFNKRIHFDRHYTSPAFLEFLINPESVFQQSNAVLLKNGRSSTVIRVRIGEQDLVVKRYNIKSFSHWLRRCLRMTRAVRCWQRAHVLLHAGIPVAKPVACIEKRFFGLRHTSWFVTEFVEGPDAGQYFATHEATEPHCQRLAKRMVKMLEALAELRMSHGDLKATNIIVHGPEHHEKPVLIDLDGVRRHYLTDQQQILSKELQRLLQNWEHQAAIRALFE